MIKNILDEYGLDAIAFVAEWKAAQRPWVGLTDEERNYCVDTPFVSQQWVNIEAKLKEKNT